MLTQTSKTFNLDLRHVGSMGIAHNEYLEAGKIAYEISSESVKRLQRYNICKNFKDGCPHISINFGGYILLFQPFDMVLIYTNIIYLLLHGTLLGSVLQYWKDGNHNFAVRGDNCIFKRI